MIEITILTLTSRKLNLMILLKPTDGWMGSYGIKFAL